MQNQDIQGSLPYDSIQPVEWNEMLGLVAQDLRGKDRQHHRYLVLNKQSRKIELANSSKLRQGQEVQKLSLSEISDISKEIFNKSEDISLNKDIRKSYSVLLQARVNKWNRLPHRLGRMVALVFLALASRLVIGRPFYIRFLTWENGKENEMKKLKDEIKLSQVDPKFQVNQQEWKEEDLIHLESYYKDVVDPKSLNLNVTFQDFTIINALKEKVILSSLQDSLSPSGSKDSITDENGNMREVHSSFYKDVSRNQNLIRKDEKLNIKDQENALFNVNSIIQKIEELKDDEVESAKGEILNVILILKEHPSVKNLREMQDIKEIKALLNPDFWSDFLKRERVLQAQRLIGQFIINEEDKKWEFLLQSLVSQDNLNPMSTLPRQLLMATNLCPLLLDCFLIEGLPPIELEILRNEKNDIQRVNVRIQGHFVNQERSKKNTRELISQRAIQATLNYGITLEESQEESQQKIEPVLHDFSLVYKEALLPTAQSSV